MNKIIKIESNFSFEVISRYTTYVGYKIVTQDRVIKIGIDDNPQCCEDYGYFSSDDNLDNYINSDFIKMEVVDKGLKTKRLEEIEGGLDQGGIIFINIYTNKGMFQIAAYNARNGYYGHEVLITCEKVEFSECI